LKRLHLLTDPHEGFVAVAGVLSHQEQNDERKASEEEGKEPGHDEKRRHSSRAHDGDVTQRLADGEILIGGESEHGQGANHSERRGNEEGSRQVYDEGTDATCVQHLDQLVLEEVEDVVAEPLDDADQEVRQGEVDEEAAVDGIGRPSQMLVDEGQEGDAVEYGAGQRQGGLRRKTGCGEVDAEEIKVTVFCAKVVVRHVPFVGVLFPQQGVVPRCVVSGGV